MSKQKKQEKPRVFFSIDKTRDERYFIELYGDASGLDMPGPCRFCGELAFHLFEETVETRKRRLASNKVDRFLCCDEPECLAKALPEIYEKFLEYFRRQAQ
ncbi:MAG: hypothetical protein WC797_00635 [Candidatus Paceibacterota bacterium]